MMPGTIFKAAMMDTAVCRKGKTALFRSLHLSFRVRHRRDFVGLVLISFYFLAMFQRVADVESRPLKFSWRN